MTDEEIEKLGEQEGKEADPLLVEEPEDPESPEKGPEDDGEPEPESEDPAPEEAPDAEDSASSKKLDDLLKQIETLDKRYKDTQSAYTKGQQRIVELEKKLEEASDDYFAEDDNEDGDSRVKDALAEKVDRIEALLAQQRWEMTEVAVKKEHDDYDAVVYETLLPELEKNTELAEQYRAAGGTPEAAYKLGRELKERQEILSDPAAYREKLKKELLETQAKEEPEEQELPDVEAGTANSAKAILHNPGSVLDELF